MIIKDKFSLLKDKSNIIDISASTISRVLVANGVKKAHSILKLEKKISHFAKDKVLKLLSDPKESKNIAIVNIPKYVLPVTYNKGTKQIIINIAPFGTDDIGPTSPDTRTLYSAIVYGYIFYTLVTKKYDVKQSLSSPIILFLITLLIRLFAKEYGLLGAYSGRIPLLKFLTSCYVYSSFFGIKGSKAYRMASSASQFNYKDIEKELNKIDFSDIDGLIDSLSKLKAMPGLNKHVFTKKFLTFFGINFLPALEDLSRFIAILTSATVSGSTIVPTYLSVKYNETEFNKIIKISETIFRK